MRLLFLCSSLESGRDGVGDYTRRFAGELVKQGHECLCLAIHDRHMANGPQAGAADGDTKEDEVKIIRLSSRESWCAKTLLIQQEIDQFEPDWVSLQFVPYGYHARGFCFALAHMLAKLHGPAGHHLFVHELSIGTGSRPSVSHRVQGFVQRMAIRRTIQHWNPQVTHTHVPHYRRQLAGYGVDAAMLPIPGSIPIVSPGPVCGDFDRLVEARRADEQGQLFAGYFGAFYEGSAAPDFIEGLRALGRSTGKQIHCFLAGHQTDDCFRRYSSLAEVRAGGVRWTFLGALPANSLSSFFQELDFGIAATSWTLLGKSSGVAAMLDHGLPILVPSEGAQSSVPSEAGALDSDLLVRLTAAESWTDGSWLRLKRTPADRVRTLAQTFAADLHKALQPLLEHGK